MRPLSQEAPAIQVHPGLPGLPVHQAYLVHRVPRGCRARQAPPARRKSRIRGLAAAHCGAARVDFRP